MGSFLETYVMISNLSKSSPLNAVISSLRPGYKNPNIFKDI